jgi:hypothetical protein
MTEEYVAETDDSSNEDSTSGDDSKLLADLLLMLNNPKYKVMMVRTLDALHGDRTTEGEFVISVMDYLEGLKEKYTL